MIPDFKQNQIASIHLSIDIDESTNCFISRSDKCPNNFMADCGIFLLRIFLFLNPRSKHRFSVSHRFFCTVSNLVFACAVSAESSFTLEIMLSLICSLCWALSFFG